MLFRIIKSPFEHIKIMFDYLEHKKQYKYKYIYNYKHV